MIHLATSYTEGYPWIEPFRKSLDAHWPTDLSRFHKTIMVIKDPPPNTRTWVVQNGVFLGSLPNLNLYGWDDNWEIEEHIAFVDADMICQRKLTDSEENDLLRVDYNEVAMGVNQWNGATLQDEAANLGQLVGDDVLDRIFPGWRQIPVWNCGFMVARRSTFQRLHDLTVPLMLPAESCFSHYATIQWVICYAVGRWLNHVLLPETICVHGLCGYRDYMTADREGNVYVNGQMAAFRHAINLTPHKCLRIEPA